MNNNKKKKRGKWRVSPSWWLNGKQKINVRFQFCDSTLCISLDVHPLNNISSEFINGMQTGKIVRSEKLSCNNRRAAIVWNQKKAFLLNYVGLRWVRRHSFSIPFNCNKVDLIILYSDDVLYYDSVFVYSSYSSGCIVVVIVAVVDVDTRENQMKRYRLPKHCWGCCATNVPKVTTNAHTISHMIPSIVSIITFWLSNRLPNHRTQFQQIEIYLHRAIRHLTWFKEIKRKQNTWDFVGHL